MSEQLLPAAQKDVDEEQRGEEVTTTQADKGLRLIFDDEDINTQINTTEQLKVEERLQVVPLESYDFKPLTLDPNTVNKHLLLSEKCKKVTRVHVRESQHYPDHKDRFDYWSQVMCKEGLAARCYWEVEWTQQVSIAVSYKGIPRKGHSDIGLFGFNEMSWSLDSYGAGTGNDEDGDLTEAYSVRHANRREMIPVKCVNPNGPNRVGVYLDYPAGKLSFYCVCPDMRRIHLWTYDDCGFTEPVYCAFWCWTQGSSVSLCQAGRGVP